MNWLIYIGGGIIFIGIGMSILSGGERAWDDSIDWIRISSLLLVWIWICWRFI